MLHSAKLNLKNKNSFRGFTLIELLVVIAVIGILAVAVLSAINPVEQINKGTDTAMKSDASEFLNAAERYYATFQAYPWGTTGRATSALSSNDAGLAELIAKGELKSEFKNRSDLTKLYVTEDPSSHLVTVCFVPKSKTFTAKATKNNDGSVNSSCPPANLSNNTACNDCVPE